MKFFKLFLGTCLLGLLAACGGGGGSAGSGNGTGTPLFTSAQSTVTVAVNGADTFGIGGGIGPYTVTSDNKFVAVAGVSGSTFTIGGVKEGTAKVQVRDRNGETVLVNVVVSDGDDTALYTTAPAAITMAPGTTTLPFEARGGTSPYVVTSSNTSVVRVNQAGSSFTLTSLIPGTANVTVMDNTGLNSKTIVVTVKTDPGTPLKLNPASASGNVGDSITVLISGGTGSYASATAANTTIATAALSGSSVTIALKAAGSTVVTVQDSAGLTAEIAVTATNAAATLRLSPTTFSVSELSTASLQSTIFGGTAPFSVFVSDQALASAAVSGSTVTIGLGTQGSRCIATSSEAVTITVIDALGASGSSVMTINEDTSAACGTVDPLTTTAGGAFTLVAGQVRSVTISGGVKFNPAPTYQVSSSNTAAATVSALTGDTFSVTAVATGVSTITVRDAANTTVTFTVTVP